MKHTFSKIWIPVIIVIIFAGGIFAWQYFEAPAEEAVQDKTANWQTYQNEEYGFEIKHPGDWVFWEYITVGLSKEVAGEEATIDIEMIKENDNRYMIPLEKMVDNAASQMKKVIQSKEKVYMEESEGYEIIGTLCTRICTGSPEDVFSPFAIVYLLHNNIIYKISYIEGITGVGWKDNKGDWKYYDEFQKILSTFRFLE